MGICPPSNAAEMFFRALEPFVPRPAVLPLEPSPRPTRVFAVLAPGAGRRWCSLIVIGLLHLFHGDQVRHGVDHAADLRTVFLDDDVADPLQTERTQRVPLVLLGADLGPDLGDLQARHVMHRPRPAGPAWPPERRPRPAARGARPRPPATRASSAPPPSRGRC